MGRVINLLDLRIQQLVKKGVMERHEKGRYPFLLNLMARVYIQARADGGGTVIDSEDARKLKHGAEERLAVIDLLIEVYEKPIFTKSRI